MLAGLAAIAIPVLLHLLNRRKSRRMEWGAMLFLEATLSERRRKILLEEMLLLATRCLIIALAAIAIARPYARSGGASIAFASLAAAAFAAAAFAAAVVNWRNRGLRIRLISAAAILAAIASASAAAELLRNRFRAAGGAAKDVAIVIDASSSMSIAGPDGRTAFEKAVREADAFIHSSPRQTSFALILAATPPRALSRTPISDRKALLEMLDAAEPLEGMFNAPDTIAAAASVLARGANGTKQIVVFGDGQSAGWETGAPEPWSRVGEILAQFSPRPAIVWRTLGVPETLRNLCVSSIAFSREAIGTDRETGIDVTISNTGDEAVTPNSLVLSIDGSLLTDASLGQILPGESRSVSFRHRFTSPGTKAVRAILDVTDDLGYDNAMVKVAAVRRESRVLVVEGSGGRRLRDRPGAFIALALSPSQGTLQSLKGAQPPQGGGAAAKSPRAFFIPTVVPAHDLPSIENLRHYDAIVLANVRGLSDDDAARIASFVELGGGLLAICGPNSDPGFFARWTDSNGTPLMPLALVGGAPGKTEGIPVDPKSFADPAISAIAADSGLATAIFSSRWETSPSGAPSCQVMARLLDGSPLLAAHHAGRGRVLQFAAALDPSSGNVSSRQGFLPLVQELAGSLVRPVSPSLNIAPGGDSPILLGPAPSPDADSPGGHTFLRAVYRTGGFDGPVIRFEIPSAKDFSFNFRQHGIDASLPQREHVFVRWSGSITVPASGKWNFRIDSSGSATVSFPNDHRYFGLRRSRMSVDLEAGTRHDIVVEWECRNRDNTYFALRWSGPGVGEQCVPASRLSPVPFNSPDVAETFPAIMEGRRGTFPATLRLDATSASLKLPPRLPGGTYSAVVPAVLAPVFADMSQISNSFARVTFSVAHDPAESALSPVTPDDIAFISRFADVTVARTPLEFRTAIEGAMVGRELWRYAAFPLLLLLVAEIALANWITRERRIGEEQVLDFESHTGVSSKFAEILSEIKGGRR